MLRRLLFTSLFTVPGLFGLSLWTGVGPVDDWVHNCEVRQSYLDRLEAMESEVVKLRVQGRSEQDIAKIMVPKRNEAKALVRTKMRPKQVSQLEERNRARYGDPAGPTVQWMADQHGGNWTEVVEATTDSNEMYDLSCLPWFTP